MFFDKSACGIWTLVRHYYLKVTKQQKHCNTAINSRKHFVYCNKIDDLLTTWDRFRLHRFHGPHPLELLKLHHFLWRKDKWCWGLTLAAPWWRGGQSRWGWEHRNAQLCPTFHTPARCNNTVTPNLKLSVRGNLIFNACIYQFTSWCFVNRTGYIAWVTNDKIIR